MNTKNFFNQTKLKNSISTIMLFKDPTVDKIIVENNVIEREDISVMAIESLTQLLCNNDNLMEEISLYIISEFYKNRFYADIVEMSMKYIGDIQSLDDLISVIDVLSIHQLESEVINAFNDYIKENSLSDNAYIHSHTTIDEILNIN